MLARVAQLRDVHLTKMLNPSDLLRVIAGESVFGLEIDSRIRQASNEMSARLMIELYNRCDDSKPGWQAEFADSLSGMLTGDPCTLIGFDDGRWQGAEINEESELPEIPQALLSYYLKLVFRNEDAAYYQFPLFPPMDEPFLAGGARKRENEFQHIRLDVSDPNDLQLFVQGLRSNPHLISVEESSEDVFRAAPSHAV